MGLVEFPFPFADRMKRHGQHIIPVCCAQIPGDVLREKVRQEDLKPKRLLIFVAVNNLQNDPFGQHSGPG